VEVDADAPHLNVALGRVQDHLEGDGLLVPRTVERGRGKQPDVVAPPHVAHEVVDEPARRRAAGGAVLPRHHDEEVPPRRDDGAALLQPVERHLDGGGGSIGHRLDVRTREDVPPLLGERLDPLM
jgi:hypothetical protein